ncbi:MAG: hypothetical protein KDA24_28195 [Deltaproteobacteria bacterium]|nr:hypothetical protein [Deltaproteobacteria bacterium]
MRLLILVVIAGCSPSIPDPSSVDDDLGTDSGTFFDGMRIAPGMLSFFEDDVCPEGWSEWEDAAGRAMVGANEGTGTGTTTGTALPDHQPSAHGHAVTGQVTVGSAGVAGIQGCCNSSPGTEGTYTVTSGVGDDRDTRLPTIAMRVCKKDGNAAVSPQTDAYPSGAVAYFDRPACPDSWSQLLEGKGRLVVGLTMFGDPLQTVGTPLADGEDRTHQHTVSGSATVSSNPISGASGGSMYAAAGAHAITGGATDDGTSGLPTVAAMLCEKD